MQGKRLIKAIALLGILAVVPGFAVAGAWQQGDVFVGVAGGQYQVYDNNGIYLETIAVGGGFTTGCAFDSVGNLYGTWFSDNRVRKIDGIHPHGQLLALDPSANDATSTPESIVFAADGTHYVGHVGGNDNIHEYDATDVFQASYNAFVDRVGTDWIDLAADQITIFHTSEGRNINRFDVAANSVLPTFAVLPGSGQAFALRLLAPFDGSGGLIVADGGNIKRLDGTGLHVQTYDVAGENGWFALNLDPNGTSFWSGDFGTSNFYRFNITTGAVEVGPINTGTGGSTLFGICVKGEITGATSCIDPDPNSQGYWHRQCLGVPASEGGIDPGRNGRGPKSPTEPDFVAEHMPCAEQFLEDLGFYGMTTCDGMDADPPSDACERALKQLTALALNVCSERVSTACEVDVAAQGCSSTTVGDLLEEAADLILSGFCTEATECVDPVNTGDAVIDPGDGAGESTGSSTDVAGPAGKFAVPFRKLSKRELAEAGIEKVRVERGQFYLVPQAYVQERAILFSGTLHYVAPEGFEAVSPDAEGVEHVRMGFRGRKGRSDLITAAYGLEHGIPMSGTAYYLIPKSFDLGRAKLDTMGPASPASPEIKSEKRRGPSSLSR